MSKLLISKVSWVITRGLVGQYVTVVFCDVAQCHSRKRMAVEVAAS